MNLNTSSSSETAASSLVLGIDEVGRGSWAGPLVVGAVALKQGFHLPGLNDSKKLTKAARIRLFPLIQENSVICKTGWVWQNEIDEIGLSQAMELAVKRALEGVVHTGKIVLDGHHNFLPNYENVHTVIKADSKVPSVSAASILAKVARDEYMRQQSLIYPEYGFANNVGYGTVQHIDALKENGITHLHRLSFKPLQIINTYI